MHPVNNRYEVKHRNEHIAECKARWLNVNVKVSPATSGPTSKKWIQDLKSCFNDDEFKAQVLLRTLPASFAANI